MSRRRSSADGLESLLLIGTLLWAGLALLRWALQRPKLWPVVALVIILARCQGSP